MKFKTNLVLFVTFSFGLLSCFQMSTKSRIDDSKIEIYELKTDLIVGTTKAGQKIPLGGLSALQLIKNENSKYSFYTITDRGPNPEFLKELEGVGRNVRPFLLPDYSPLLIQITTSEDKKSFSVDKTYSFNIKKNLPLTGLPHKNPNLEESELPIDIYGNKLSFDSNGADSEGFCKFNNNYLISEEYGPQLFMFNSKMMLLKKWTPGVGLPADFAKRKMNRGLEGLACSKNFAYLMLQSPLKTGDLIDKDFIRIAKFDPVKGKTIKEYFYPITKEADKVGDISLITEDKLLIIEQNGKLGSKEGVRRVYKVDLSKANPAGQLQKELIVDLNRLGFDFVEKIEGLAYIDSKTIAIITDNDFALHGDIDLKTGLFKFRQQPSYLAIIHLDQEIR